MNLETPAAITEIKALIAAAIEREQQAEWDERMRGTDRGEYESECIANIRNEFLA